MEQTDRDQKGIGGNGAKKGEGTSIRTYMNDPWTWTTVWKLTVGVGFGWVEEGKGGKIGTTLIE